MPKQNPNAGVIGARTVRNFPFLYELYKTRSTKKRHYMLKNANRDQLLSIIDICANIHRGDFHLTKRQSHKLERHKEFLKKLSRVRSESGARRIIQKGEGIIEVPGANRSRDKLRVIQRGGALPALLVPVLVELAASGVDYLIDKFTGGDSDD